MPQDNKIKLRRGLNSALPAAGTEVGELRYSTDTRELYIDDGTTNRKIGSEVATSGVNTATQTALDAVSVAPTIIVPTATAGSPPGATAWPAVNRALFSRFYLAHPATFRYLNWNVGVASGNVQLGVVALSGSGHTAFTRVMNSGIIACPSAADIRTDLGATVLPAGDYAAFLWADNTTVTARWISTSGLTPTRTAGTLSGLATGVLSSGTLAWSSQAALVVLEGDV